MRRSISNLCKKIHLSSTQTPNFQYLKNLNLPSWISSLPIPYNYLQKHLLNYFEQLPNIMSWLYPHLSRYNQLVERLYTMRTDKPLHFISHKKITVCLKCSKFKKAKKHTNQLLHINNGAARIKWEVWRVRWNLN